MLESLFQTFLLLAYFDIALLSVAIANYALSASYLGRETRLSKWRIEKRTKKLQKEIKELAEKPQINEIREKINEHKKEVKRLSRRLFFLSFPGSVVSPSVFFMLSFMSAVLGLNSETMPFPQFLQQQSLLFSLGAMGIGFLFLFYVLAVVEWAAKRIALPEFEVNFATGLRTEECKSKENKEIGFGVTNVGEDVAEDVEIYVNFPPEFEVHSKPSYYRITKQRSIDEYPNYNAVIVNIDILHLDITFEVLVSLTMPEKEGTYQIPIDIRERKLGVKEDKLIIKII